MKRSLAIVLSLLMVLGLGAGFALADSEVEQINGEAILYAGQNIRVGMVNVTNDNDNIYVKFQLNSDEWCITETHVHVGKSLEYFPRTRPGNPIPGHFEYFGQHDCENQEDIMYTIPLGNWKVGNEILIAAHAVVEKEEFEGDRVNETAWGAGKRFVNRGNWATYFVYTIVAPPPPDNGDGEVRTETAYVGNKDVNVGSPGSWWYYFAYGVGEHNIIAGQDEIIGTVSIRELDNDEFIEITINFNPGWGFKTGEDKPVKIYGFEAEPSGSRPNPGHSPYKYDKLVIEIAKYNFYVIHLDVQFNN